MEESSNLFKVSLCSNSELLNASFYLTPQYNAKVNIADSDGKTALYYARLNRNKDIEELLIQQGCTETSTFSDNACLPRRRESLNMSKASDVFDKLPASII